MGTIKSHITSTKYLIEIKVLHKKIVLTYLKQRSLVFCGKNKHKFLNQRHLTGTK